MSDAFTGWVFGMLGFCFLWSFLIPYL